jgi:DNA-binding NarL/FixJ family response regulator
MQPVKIVMIEDNAAYADSLARYFRHPAHGIECIAIHPDAESALARIPGERPEVALVDLHMPGMGGVECIARLAGLDPAPIPLVLTTFDDSNLLFDALKAGACGYLLKTASPAEVAEAIHQVRAGGSPMSLRIARKVVNHFRRQAKPAAPSVLSVREQEVVDQLATGARYKEIASNLGVSIETVRSHIKNIYGKLHVNSRTEAVNKLRGNG